MSGAICATGFPPAAGAPSKVEEVVGGPPIRGLTTEEEVEDAAAAAAAAAARAVLDSEVIFAAMAAAAATAADGAVTVAESEPFTGVVGLESDSAGPWEEERSLGKKEMESVGS